LTAVPRGTIVSLMQTISERTTRRTPRVPRGDDNPIRFLNKAGVRVIELANAWQVTPDAVRKMRRFDFAPKYETAKRMAATFGWRNAGEVMEFYAERRTA
jgi:hypothetical protein